MENLVKKFTKSSLALPLIALALLLLFNALFVDNFFKIEIMQTVTSTVVLSIFSTVLHHLSSWL